MKINKILIAAVIFLMIFVNDNSLKAGAVIYDYAGESIQYRIEPVGKSEYKNLGMVDLKGVKANLITLKSRILFVEVAEKIYSDPVSLLPYRTERTTSGPWFKEYRTEEYNQKNFTVVVKKFKGKKLVKNQLIKSNEPIQNMNLLLFYLRKQPSLKIGWHFTAKILDELKILKLDLKLISIDDITVPAGKFQAYHFKTTPDKFEVWISKAEPRIPLEIIVKGIVHCTILTEKYSLHGN
jgi:hypothetical protein